MILGLINPLLGDPGLTWGEPYYLGVTVTGDVEMIPRRCFQHVAVNLFKGHAPFKRGVHPYVNFYQKVFRARNETAGLIISDWSSDTEPGGPVGQELMFNFLELAPYLQD